MSLLADVASLKARPLPEIRENIARKVSVYFNQGIFDKSEENIACDIIRILTKDVELSVRKTLSENLKNTYNLPHDIAKNLATDVLEVSLPILEFSTVLTDDDLVAIIKSTKQVAALLAIARRDNASETISGELINTSNEDVVVSLFLNGTARISQGSLEFAFNEFKNNGKVVGALINRGDLSVAVVEKILNVVSIEIRNELIKSHRLDEKKAEALMRSAQETVTLGLLDTKPTLPPVAVPARTPEVSGKNTQTESLVNHLLREGLLTESLILRSLCEGNILFFEISMARRAGIPVINARTLMQDGNSAALRSLWRRAKMPESAFDAMNIIINFAVTNSNNNINSAAYSQKLLEYLQEKGYARNTPLMPYIMSLIASGVRIQDVV